MMIDQSQLVSPEDTPEPVTSYQPQWDRSTRNFMTIFLIIAIIYGLTLLGSVIQMLTIAFLIAYVMYEPSKVIARSTPISYSGAVSLLYVLLIIVVMFLIVNIIPSIVSGIDGLISSTEEAYGDLVVALEDYEPEDGRFEVFGVTIDLNSVIEPIREFMIPPEGSENMENVVDLQTILDSLGNLANTFAGSLTGAISTVAGFVTTLLLALFISFLILLDLPNSQRTIARWIPPRYHREVALLMQQLERLWDGFFRGQVTIGIIIGVLTFIQLTVMGIPNASLLAIFTGVISLIPTIGGFLALIPLSLIPLLQGSTVLDLSNGVVALLVVGINLVISQVIWNVVAPKILGDAINLPIAFIIVGVFIGAAIGGILGAFFVVPIMGTIRVFLVYVLMKLGQQDPFPDQVPRMGLGMGRLTHGGKDQPMTMVGGSEVTS